MLLQGPHSHAGIAQNSIATDQCIVRGSRQHAQAIMGTNSPAIPVASSMTLKQSRQPTTHGRCKNNQQCHDRNHRGMMHSMSSRGMVAASCTMETCTPSAVRYICEKGSCVVCASDANTGIGCKQLLPWRAKRVGKVKHQERWEGCKANADQRGVVEASSFSDLWLEGMNKLRGPYL